MQSIWDDFDSQSIESYSIGNTGCFYEFPIEDQISPKTSKHHQCLPKMFLVIITISATVVTRKAAAMTFFFRFVW